MSDQIALGFEFARNFAEQLITLSIGIITLSVAFTKEVVRGVPRGSERLLGLGWLFFLGSVLLGLLHIMALTGQLAPVDPSPAEGIGVIPRRMALGQVTAFLGGVAVMIWYGIRTIRHVNATDRS